MSVDRKNKECYRSRSPRYQYRRPKEERYMTILDPRKLVPSDARLLVLVFGEKT